MRLWVFWLRRLTHIDLLLQIVFASSIRYFFLRHIGRLLPNFSSLFVASGKAAFCPGQSSALHRWAYLPYREDTTTSMVQGGYRWFCCCQLRLLQLLATYAETKCSTAGETTGGCSAGNLSEGPTWLGTLAGWKIHTTHNPDPTAVHDGTGKLQQSWNGTFWQGLCKLCPAYQSFFSLSYATSLHMAFLR